MNEPEEEMLRRLRGVFRCTICKKEFDSYATMIHKSVLRTRYGNASYHVTTDALNLNALFCVLEDDEYFDR